jgi:hypothetical protein
MKISQVNLKFKWHPYNTDVMALSLAVLNHKMSAKRNKFMTPHIYWQWISKISETRFFGRIGEVHAGAGIPPSNIPI